MQNVHRKKKSKEKNHYIFGFFCCRVWQCKEGNVENNRQFNSNFLKLVILILILIYLLTLKIV